ncbi:MAG: hypothetical protein WA991_01610 [Ornithinimicrobium sp.]
MTQLRVWHACPSMHFMIKGDALAILIALPDNVARVLMDRLDA